MMLAGAATVGTVSMTVQCLRSEALAGTNGSMIGWKRYVVVLVGLIMAGAVCVPVSSYTLSLRGVIGPTLLQGQSPLGACMAMIAGLAAATVVGAVVGRLVNAVMGLFVIGVGLGVLAFRFGSIADLAFAEGSLLVLALETTLWAGAVLGSTWVVFRIAGPLPDFVAQDAQEPATSRWTLHGAAAGVAMLPVVWLIARSELRGQTLAATILGGLAAGLIARLLSPHTQPRLIFPAACLMGGVGHIIGAVVVVRHATARLDEVYVALALPKISYPLPIDFAVGSLIGVAMGLGWAASFLQHEHEDEAAPGTLAAEQ